MTEPADMPSAPRYRYHVDEAHGPVISGWVCEAGRDQPLEVEIRFAGECHRVTASVHRPRVQSRGLHTSGHCGFSLAIDRRLVEPASIAVIGADGGASFHLEAPHGQDEHRSDAVPARRLFHVHIPKTGGTSINGILTELYGPAESRVHIENSRDWEALSQMRFLSGHVRLRQVRRHLPPGAFLTFAMLRDPVKQLVSHLSWVRHLAEPGEEEKLERHPDYIQALARKLAAVDFSSPDELAAFLEQMDTRECQLFDNCQTRYLCDAPTDERLGDSHLESALQNLQRLDIIGLTERFDETLERLYAAIGHDGPRPTRRRDNVTRYDYGFASTNAALVAALQPALALDRMLYHRARQAFERPS